MSKAIDKNYLLTQLKNFDEKVLSKYNEIVEVDELPSIPEDKIYIINSGEKETLTPTIKIDTPYAVPYNFTKFLLVKEDGTIEAEYPLNKDFTDDYETYTYISSARTLYHLQNSIIYHCTLVNEYSDINIYIKDKLFYPTNDSLKMDKTNPTGIGSFSLNRTPGSVIGDFSVAEGAFTTASGDYSHAEGGETTASGPASHAEGVSTTASGDYSHAEGVSTTASGDYSHAEGGETTATGIRAHTEGYKTEATKESAHAEGCYTMAKGISAHSEGYNTVAVEIGTHAEGQQTKALGKYSHAEGFIAYAYGQGTHAEGSYTAATGYQGAHAEGFNTIAFGNYGSHAEGSHAIAYAPYSHAEGRYSDYAATQDIVLELESTYDLENDSLVFTNEFTDYEQYPKNRFVILVDGKVDNPCVIKSLSATSIEISHPKTNLTNGQTYILKFTIARGAFGDVSHSEGVNTSAYGSNSHAEGAYTVAEGESSHAEGWGTKATGKYSHAEGKWNVEDTTDKYAHIIGNGASDTKRSNAMTVDWSGNAVFAGTVTGKDATGKVVTLGDGGAEVVELTQAEYDALPESKLTDDKIYAIKDSEGASASGNYPSYVVKEKNRLLNQLIEHMNIKNPIIFGFSTDQHLYSSNPNIEKEVCYGLNALRDLTQDIPFNAIVLGGDCSSTTKSEILLQKDVLAVTKAVKNSDCPIFHIGGNHDSYQNVNTISAGAVFKSHITMPYKEKYVTQSGSTLNSYYDDLSCNIRFIFLWSTSMNGYEKTAAKTFLGESLASLPSGYQAIIFSHHPLGNLPDDTSKKADDWNEPLKWGDVVNPYADKIICCVSGHVHCDKTTFLDGILYISTTCGGVFELNDGSTRTPGRADYTAYDIYVIDRENEMIHTIRYGNGSNRDITYQGTISYTNQIPISIDSDGSVYNEVGYMLNKRLNSGGLVTDKENCGVTGFIPVNNGDIIRLKNCNLSNTGGLQDYVATYDSTFTKISSSYAKSSTHITDRIVDSNDYITQFTVLDTGYMRISAIGIGETAVITVNEMIK